MSRRGFRPAYQTTLPGDGYGRRFDEIATIDKNTKPLPIQTLPIVEQWDCHSCGNCCRGSIVPLDQADLARLKGQKWDEHPDYRGTAVVARDGWWGGQRLAQRDDGSCVFLTPEGLCRIHAEFGFEAKPIICRTYPLQLVPLDKLAYLTIRRSCPSAALDRGQPVDQQRAAIRKLHAAGRGIPLASAAPRLSRRFAGDWSDFMAVSERLARLLADNRFPLVRRLVHGVVFCEALEASPWSQLDATKRQALLDVLEGGCTDRAGDYFRERKPPSRSGAILFRLAAAVYARLQPGLDAERSWRERWRMLRASLAMVRGKGPVPPLHPLLPSATFESLEQPLGSLADDVLGPLTRYYETSALSRQFAILDRKHWPLLDSFRGLALTFAVALWLLRARSTGRQPTQADTLDILTALDRGQGFALLASSQHLFRVGMIARLGDLPRLIAWYGR